MNLWWMVVACNGGDGETGPGPKPSDGTGAGCGEVDPPAQRTEGSGPRPARAVTGRIAYHVDFDAAAEADGKVDCDYTRSYVGTEAVDQPWLCPSCTLTFAADTEIDDVGCYADVGTAAQRHPEWIGFDDGFWRAQVPNADLAEFCTGVASCSVLEVDPGGADVAYTATGQTSVDGLHGYSISGVGTFTFTDGDGEEVTPLDGYRTEPYACGWPLRSPGGPSPWTAAVGDVFPNFRQRDACGDDFDFWDLRGSYVILVVDEAGHLTPGDYDAFHRVLASLNADCIPTELVVVVADAFASLTTTPDRAAVDAFAQAHELTGPVLADAGVVNGLFADVGSFDALFPGGGLVGPDGVLLEVLTSDENAAAFERAVRRDLDGR